MEWGHAMSWCAVIGLMQSGAVAAPLTVRIESGPSRAELRVEHPERLESPAVRLTHDLADKAGRVPAPVPGYTVFARVVVRAPSDEIARLLRATPGVRSVSAHEGVFGFTMIETDSVRRATEVAGQLRAHGLRAELDTQTPRSLRGLPSDPSFGQQWHLRNTLLPIADLNAEAAWGLGWTGQGVTVGIVEGGWQTTHPDLAANFHAAASTAGGSATNHSTSCAGLVAAVDNNGAGGVGVAFNARLSNLVYGSAAATATALTFRNDLNHIKSNSWGPDDLGILEFMTGVERAAIEQAATLGRGGLGTVLCWSAGNGGTDDRVDYDPYASSRHTLAIGSVGDQDTRADYNESGSSIFVVTHSSGNQRDVFTTGSNSGYNPSFGGTSAASPIAAGVVALMLEANPDLSVRDIQHILARTARRCDPGDPGWAQNAGGRWFNPNYGFGAIDAGAAVSLAADWESVSPEQVVTSGTVQVGQPIPDNTASGRTLTVTIPEGIRAESVELVMQATTTYIGDLRITLTSPAGTVSVLTEPRDDPQDDLEGYLFTSVRHWDESAGGVWTVKVADLGPLDLAVWESFEIRVYGTPIGPVACNEADLAEPLGVLSFFDVGAFLWYFGQGDGSADLDGSGGLNFFDVSRFLSSYNAGCP